MTEPIDLARYRNKRLPTSRFLPTAPELVKLYRDGKQDTKVGLCFPILDEALPGFAMNAEQCRVLAGQLLQVADILDDLPPPDDGESA